MRNDRGGLDVAGFALIDELLAVDADQVGTGAAELLGDEDTLGLLGKDDSGGMVLDAVEETHGHTRTIGHDKAIAGSAVMVGGHEALDVQPARAASRHDHSLGLGDRVFTGLHVVQDGTGTVAVLVEDELDRRGKLDHIDVGAVARFIANGAHDFGTGDVGGVVHSLAAGAATVDGL